MRGVHGEKIVATLESDKLPVKDKPRLEVALQRYDAWVEDLKRCEADTWEELIPQMVNLLNAYKLHLDVEVIFDSEEDFLYRQKGQLKLDNTVMEEFLPILVGRCLDKIGIRHDLVIGSQVATYSAAYFSSAIGAPEIGGGIKIKTKDQDFSVSRQIFLKSSYDRDFASAETATLETHLGYIQAELKTNLDKTMFQEAAATAHDVKQAVTGSRYYLLCDFLDMTPISTSTTDIDEILIMRKAKRLSSNIRKQYGFHGGRVAGRREYIEFLQSNPYCEDMFERFVGHIISQVQNEVVVEENVLSIGYF